MLVDAVKILLFEGVNTLFVDANMLFEEVNIIFKEEVGLRFEIFSIFFYSDSNGDWEFFVTFTYLLLELNIYFFSILILLSFLTYFLDLFFVYFLGLLFDDFLNDLFIFYILFYLIFV